MAPETSEKIENAPIENVSLEHTAPDLDLAASRQGEHGEARLESVRNADRRLASAGIFAAGASDETPDACLQMTLEEPEIIESARHLRPDEGLRRDSVESHPAFARDAVNDHA